MKLTLRNLGRLREATVDLSKDLIVLTGPNNTSKTYVAHAIYGFGDEILPLLSLSVGPVLHEFVTGKQGSDASLSIDLVAFFEQHLSQILKEIAQLFHEKLADTLASSAEFVARTEAKLELGEEQLASARQNLLDHEERLVIDRAGLTVSKIAGDPIWTCEWLPTPSAEVTASSSLFPDRKIFPLLGYINARISFMLASFFLQMPLHTHVLTAERAAIQLFSRELSLKRTELVDDLLKLSNSSHRRADTGRALEETLEQRAQRYPLAIRTSLLIANDPAMHKAKTSSYASLADQLERGLLGGAIRIDEEGEMSFQPNDSDTRLGLHLASSSVKSLAGLSFFLRHIAEKNQFLIIDEPELNLHPDNQRRVARLIARLARSGIKVLISTHSDYVIRELNNLIMLSADKDGSVRQRLGYDEQETLSPAQVGAYLFDTERANPIDVTPTGIEVETIDREINALNSVSQGIYFSLFNKTGA